MDAEEIEHDRDEQEKAERYRKSLADWLTVKVYAESRQQREIQDDIEALIADGLNPYVEVKEITALMVHADEYERACDRLGVFPIKDNFS